MASLDTTAISRRPAAETIPGYRLENLVGMGGMGEVHKAIQLSLGRIVAVKLLNPELAKDPAFVARFDKEAAALAALSHPNIVSIVDKGRSDTTYFLVMEFVEGPSLREQVRSPLLTPKEALRMMMEICRAVEYAHSRGVIHRDLKPENILFDQQAGGLAKVTDFGLASFLDDANSRYNLTSTHVSMGTLSYMAPEQRVDAKTADKRADIFSLGVILYELLTGEVPLGTFDPPSATKPGIDSRLDAIVGRCLKPDPDERYSTVAEMMADLEPLAPVITSQPPKPLTVIQRVKAGVGRAARFTGRVVATLLVLAAAGELGREWLQTKMKLPPIIAGTALSSDLGPTSVKSIAGRKVKGTERRSMEMGEGADQLYFLVSGRTLDIDGKALVFPALSRDHKSRTGQAVADVDVMEMEGDTALLKADVLTSNPAPTPIEEARNFLLGEPPAPQAALMLVGVPGRFVGLVQEGSGAPLRLEWVLGERRGTMLGQASPEGVVHFEMEVDAEGMLRGFVGTGKDRRPIGEPLILGREWQKQFGELPRAAVGCIDGTCRVEGLSYSVRKASNAPPTAVAEAPVSRPTPVATKPAVKLAPPAKKPPAKAPAPPPKGGKKR
ncbi:serine/threonine-protein kinase [Hyalangium minutum]|uniref:Serine/threonine protein kinase PrkC, regulator of stationary phase n=1 Tax=Hyalangium minutum TaxID=394096 RepID=A0A085WCL3_9BACT|nr:serine/threonine-protein kinase [Hyalangium minutum]KFE65426.1 Serine/threonine protein kinase PrkC, regulator of stationary phase [Hyalangium minutum]